MHRVLVLLLAALPSVTAAQSISVQVRASTAGPGIEVQSALSSRLSLRLSGHYLSVESVRDLERGGLSYRVDGVLATGSVGMGLDFHIARRARLSIGLWSLLASGELEVTPTGAAVLAGGTLEPEEIGNVTLQSSFPERPAPYLGLGWHLSPERRLGVVADVGLLHVGSPNFRSDGEGGLRGTSGWTDVLETEFASLRLYPIVSVGLAVRLDAPTR